MLIKIISLLWWRPLKLIILYPYRSMIWLSICQETLFCDRTLLRWRQCIGKQTGEFDGYMFRPLTAKQTIKKDKITGHLVNEIVKRRVLEAKCPFASEMTAHSLRSGMATEAYIKGASLAQIMEHGRWKDMKTAMGYIQVGRQFSDSALNVF